MGKYILTTTFAVIAALFVQNDAAAQTFTGSVRGLNTVDKIGAGATPGDTVRLTVRATGSGVNKLKVEVQYYTFGSGRWVTLRRLFVTPGSMSTTTYTVPNDPDYTEFIRYRVSRKIGTQRIDYRITKR